MVRCIISCSKLQAFTTNMYKQVLAILPLFSVPCIFYGNIQAFSTKMFVPLTRTMSACHVGVLVYCDGELR